MRIKGEIDFTTVDAMLVLVVFLKSGFEHESFWQQAGGLLPGHCSLIRRKTTHITFLENYPDIRVLRLQYRLMKIDRCLQKI